MAEWPYVDTGEARAPFPGAPRVLNSVHRPVEARQKELAEESAGG